MPGRVLIARFPLLVDPPMRVYPFTSSVMYVDGLVSAVVFMPTRLDVRSPLNNVLDPLPMRRVLETDVPPLEMPGPMKMLLLPVAMPVAHPI